MKNLLFVLLLCASLVSAATPDKADYSVMVHVVASHQLASGLSQVIEVVIDGQRMELTGMSQGVLALGDYPARISPKVHAPSKNPNTYDIYKAYDFLMPDGNVRTYAVTGVEGPAAP